MMAEHVVQFVSGLITETKRGKLDWKPFAVCEIKAEVLEDIENGAGDFDPGVNSVRVSNSFYLKSGSGYVFVFEIYHGDPIVTSPELDTVSLMVKINDALPLDDLSGYGNEKEQRRLETLKMAIERYFEDKYSYPDVLYDFMGQVFSDIDDAVD